MKKHIIWIVIGCTIPLLLIFFAPALGLDENVSFFIFIIAMFACHLLMPMHHGHKHGAHQDHSRDTKTERHESH